MRLIHNDAVVICQQWISLRFGQQNAIGHQLNEGVIAAPVVETDRAADFTTPLNLQFLRDAARNGKCRHASWLGAADFGFNPQSGFEAHFGNLGGFAGTGFTGDNHNLMSPDGRNDVIFSRCDGQVRWIIYRRYLQPALLSPGHRSPYFYQQPV